MGAGAQLRGADVLVRTLQAAGEDLQDLSEVERQAGQLLAEQGSRRSPRRSGRLAAAHGYQVLEDRLSVIAATPYAAIVHARNPWLTRSVDDAEDQVADLYLAGVDAALSHVKGT